MKWGTQHPTSPADGKLPRALLRAQQSRTRGLRGVAGLGLTQP